MDTTINTVLSEKIARIKRGEKAYTTGRVRFVREYILEATGLDDVSYFEKVTVGDQAEA